MEMEEVEGRWENKRLLAAKIFIPIPYSGSISKRMAKHGSIFSFTFYICSGIINL
jgi:hypothetical protein